MIMSAFLCRISRSRATLRVVLVIQREYKSIFSLREACFWSKEGMFRGTWRKISVSHLTLRLMSREAESQKENEYAHSLLEKIVSYRTRLVQLTETELSNKEINVASSFNELSCLPDNPNLERMLKLAHKVIPFDGTVKVVLGSEKLRELTDKIMEQVSVATNDQLKRIVYIFSCLYCAGAQRELKHQVSLLAISVKDQLLKRNNLDVDSFLYFMDFFNHFNRKALSMFLATFTARMDYLNKEQSILLLHHLSVSFTSHKRHDLLAKLEEKIEYFFDSCSCEELAVASLGFFRSRYILTSETLVEKLSLRLLNDVGSLSEMTIVCVIKIINYSARNGTAYTSRTVRQNMRRITQCLLPNLTDFSPSSCTNMFRISASLHQLNHDLIGALCQKVVLSDIDHWRLKDLAWFTFTFGQYQCMMEDKHWFYDKLIKSLGQDSRRTEVAAHPQALVQALVGLSLVDIYPKTITNYVMTTMFRNKLKGRIPLDLSRDLFFLDQGIRIERPRYDGFLLPQHFFEELPNNCPILSECRLPYQKNKFSKRDEMLLQLQSSLDILCGEDMFAEIAFVFRHHNTADIILKVDEEKQPVPISDWSETNVCVKSGSVQTTLIILLAAPNCYTIYDTGYGYSRKLLGTHITKRRQAELLGHIVLEIPYYKWYDRGTNRRHYLRDLLHNFVSFDR